PAHERDHGTLDPNLPNRTARPHPHREPDSPSARPARIRSVLQRPPNTPRPACRSSTSPTPPADHRIRPTESHHHPTTRSTRRPPPRIPPCRLNSTDEVFGTFRVDTRIHPGRMTWMLNSAPTPDL